MAAEAAAGQNSFFDAKVIPSVAYTDPEVAWVGLTENEAKAKGVKYGKGVFPWAASGPLAVARAATRASPRCCSTRRRDRIIGCGIVGPNAGDLIAEAALAIEMGADADGHRPDHPPAPDAVGDDRHGGRDVRGHDHRPRSRPRSADRRQQLTGQGGRAMALKQDFAQQIEQQIAVWQAQIKDYQERMARLAQRRSANYEKAIAPAARQYRAGEQAAAPGPRRQRDCLEGHAGSLAEALERLQKGWADALERFALRPPSCAEGRRAIRSTRTVGSTAGNADQGRKPWTTSSAKPRSTITAFPTPGKISVTPTKGMTNQRDLALAYSPGRGGALPGDPEGPARGLRLHRQGQSGGGDHQRHRRAGPGQHRRAGRQAGDGGQGLPVQEVRRHRRVRHRDRRDRPRQAGRDHRLAGADLRRHQPRGHQGARVLRRSRPGCASG